jgi:hypothetical protein
LQFVNNLAAVRGLSTASCIVSGSRTPRPTTTRSNQMRTNPSPKMRIRVASATAVTLASLTLSGGVAGALNFRSADHVTATPVPATAEHPSTATSIRVRQMRVRQMRVRQVRVTSTTVGSNVAGGRLTYR